ncbi:MAG: hypothetical protein ACK5SS_08100, partial [Cyclobacteriaceae bacterium]
MLPVPVVLSVTGGGNLALGSMLVTLSGSQHGTQYQLLRNGANMAAPQMGNGSDLMWPVTQEGSYTVTAQLGSCTAPMAGTATFSNGLVSDQVEFNALKELFQSTNGANWANKTNWPVSWPASASASEMATWYGVGVENGDIQTIWLQGNNLIGTLPPGIGNLTQLRVLNMRANLVTGAIPNEWSTLVNLTEFEFFHTSISGPLPGFLKNFNHLRWITIGSANLTGPVPDYGGLPALRVLGLEGNLTPGPVPSWISTLPSLAYFSMANSKRTGTIPEWVGNLTGLISFNLSNNQLTGPIPASIGNCTWLTALDLGNNQLSGNLPAALNKLTSLTRLVLQTNQFTGTWPYLGDLVNLQHADLSATPTYDRAPIPEWVGNLRKLQYLDLNNTNRSGAITPALANLSSINELRLQYNQLTGNVPAFLTTLPALHTLFLFANQLSGELPQNWSGTPQLYYLQISGNRLTGSVPASLLALPSLRFAYFHSNDFTSIPNFNTAVNKANLYLRVDNNRLDFSSLEPNFTGNGTHGFTDFVYAPQKNFQDQQRLDVTVNSLLEIVPRPLTPNATIIWEKESTPGAWTSVNTSNQNTTQSTWRQANAVSAHAGNYRYRVSSTRVPGLMLSSEPIIVATTEVFTASPSVGQALYNGNITAMTWRTDPAYATGTSGYKGMFLYEYDDRYQIKEAQFANPNFSANTFALEGNRFRETGFTYDPNGNLLTLKRYNLSQTKIHDFTYSYQARSNRLTSVSGYVNAYTYNAVGQMIGQDNVTGQDLFVDYDVSGKVTTVYSDAARTKFTTKYLYDDRGFRLAKETYNTAGVHQFTTWYVRDASGN